MKVLTEAARRRAGPPPWGSLAGLAVIAALAVAPMAIERTTSPCFALVLRTSAPDTPMIEIATRFVLISDEISRASDWPRPVACTAYYWLAVFNPPPGGRQ
jgi:hypothetical protein